MLNTLQHPPSVGALLSSRDSPMMTSRVIPCRRDSRWDSNAGRASDLVKMSAICSSVAVYGDSSLEATHFAIRSTFDFEYPWAG